jgi:hypothetical protein
MASWSCVLLRVNVLTSQQLHSGFSVNFDFICHFEFTLSGLICEKSVLDLNFQQDVLMTANNPNQSDWCKHEKRVEKKVEEAFPDHRFRVAVQPTREYGDGEERRTMRMDIEVAERRQGGRHYVFDAKDFNGPLPASEIRTTEEYKTRSRASGSAVVTGTQTTIPPKTAEVAEEQHVAIVQDNRNLASNLQKVAAEPLGQTYVHGYDRENGTHVAPHLRSKRHVSDNK